MPKQAQNLNDKTGRRFVKLDRGGPIKLKPTQTHKTKKTYDRKKSKLELKHLIKTP